MDQLYPRNRRAHRLRRTGPQTSRSPYGADRQRASPIAPHPDRGFVQSGLCEVAIRDPQPARERDLTVYDAAYLELAIREGLPLATLDRALEKAAFAEGVALFGA